MINDLPYQQHIDAGYFWVVERQYNDRLGGKSYVYSDTCQVELPLLNRTGCG
jgi:hypothetical protein